MAQPPRSDPSLWSPPSGITLCSALTPTSFAHESTTKRWPAILGNLTASLQQATYALSYSSKDQQDKIKEAEDIVESVQAITESIAKGDKLKPIRGGPDKGGGPDTSSSYDQLIEAEGWTWHNAPWLFAECYLYRLLRSLFSASEHWKNYDPFSRDKLSTFRSSGAAIRALADNLQQIVTRSASSSQEDPVQSTEAHRVLFLEMAQMSLFGNATDLSLLTNLSFADIQALQATGKEQQAARARFILANDLDAVWRKVSSLEHGRVDMVLDNAGFELVTDLIFADWLLSTPYVDKVVFHPKNMPWFVSDVTPPDFKFTIDALLSDRFFDAADGGAADEGGAAKASGGSALRHRSTSRNRDLRADPSVFASGQPLQHPAGSRALQYQPDDAARVAMRHPSPSRHLQMRGDDDQQQGERGRPMPLPKGSMALKLDPAYFKNARSRTVSPSRSYVIDSSAFASFTLEDGPTGRGRDEDEEGTRGRTDESPSRARRPSAQRGRSGFRSVGVAEDIPEDAELDASASQQQQHGPSNVQLMARRWQRHVQEGRFELSVSADLTLEQAGKEEAAAFWTLPYAFADLPKKDPKLLQELKKSDLVIFKGDLNYRKLTSDANWPHDTPFATALGPLAGELPILALRTCKADVCVGLETGQAEKVAAEDARWQVNGKWAVVQFLDRSV